MFRSLLVLLGAILCTDTAIALNTLIGTITNTATLKMYQGSRVEVVFSTQEHANSPNLSFSIIQSNGAVQATGTIYFGLLNQINNLLIIQQTRNRQLESFIPTILSTLLISTGNNIPALNSYTTVDQIQLNNGQLSLTVSGYEPHGNWTSLNVIVLFGSPGTLLVHLHTGFLPIVHTIDLIPQPIFQIHIPQPIFQVQMAPLLLHQLTLPGSPLSGAQYTWI